MPRKDNVTYEAFEQVANELVGSGIEPTVRAIRGRTGGSNTTLLRHHDKWKQLRTAPTSPTDLPPELVSAVRLTLDRSVAKARSEEQAQAVELRNVVEDLTLENEALQDQVVELSTQCAELMSERDSLKGHQTAQALELTTLQELVAREHAAAESARVEVAKVKLLAEAADASRIAQENRERELRAELKAASDAMDSLRSEKSAFERSAAVHLAQLEAERQAHGETQSRTATFASQAESMSNAVARLAATEAANNELRSALQALNSLVTRIAPPCEGVSRSTTLKKASSASASGGKTRAKAIRS